MRVWIASILIGVLVGGLYGLLRTRSPAPPPVALAGLAAMLLGERLVALLRPLF